MGNEYFAIVIFAVVAVVLVFRLRSVLGRRTGTERPPMAVPPRRDGAPNPGGNVIDITPNRSNGAQGPANGALPLGAAFAQIRAADPKFSPDTFVKGAAQAFPMIVTAFAEGDTAALRRLLSDEVYDTFAEIIRNRLAARESAHAKIIRLDQPVIVRAGLEGRTARVDVKFVSQQIFVLRNQLGEVVEGDPDQPAERTDIWSFARNTRSLDPNWMLIATAPGE
jgi:predicted lipid-binding transport protein (Tim44 family)